MTTLAAGSDPQDRILTRLAICHLEITGIQRTWKTPPSIKLMMTDLPCVYFLVGGLVDTIPAGQAGTVTITRSYIARLLVSTFGVADADSEDGAIANQLALPFYARFANYYLTHPRLHTDGVHEDALEELVGLSSDIIFTDSGLIPRVGPGGSEFAAIDFTLQISMKMNVESLLF